MFFEILKNGENNHRELLDNKFIFSTLADETASD